MDMKNYFIPRRTAIDLDDVVVSTVDVKTCAFAKNKMQPQPISCWYVTDAPKEVRDDILHWFTSGKVTFGRPIDMRAIFHINRMMANPNRFDVIITARPAKYKPQTYLQLASYGLKIPYDRLFVVGVNVSKVDTMKDAYIKVLFDDKPKNITEAHDNGIVGHLISSGNTLYNHEMRDSGTVPHSKKLMDAFRAYGIADPSADIEYNIWNHNRQKMFDRLFNEK